MHNYKELDIRYIGFTEKLLGKATHVRERKKIREGEERRGKKLSQRSGFSL